MAGYQVPFEAYTGKEPYTFVSYSHEDKVTVFHLIGQLQEKGYRIWYDKENAPGDKWADNIEKNLKGAASVLFFITNHSVKSNEVQNEIHLALDLGIPIVPVFLQRTELAGGLDLRLNRFHWVKYYEYSNQDEFLSELLRFEHLKKCCKPYELGGNNENPIVKPTSVGSKHPLNKHETMLVGREEELEDICKAFASNNRIVILSGLVGIGKTELAREFITNSRGLFSYIQTVKMCDIEKTDERKSTFLDILLNNMQYDPEMLIKLYGMPYAQQRQIMRAYLESLDRNTLVVIYNAHNITPVNIAELYEDYRCCFLITTRKEAESKYAHCIEVKAMKEEDLLQLFEMTLGAQLSISERVIFRQLLVKLQSHTMAVVMFANLMKCQKRTLAEVTEIADRIDKDDAKIYIPENPDNEYNTVFAHLHALFNTAGLNETAKRVLSCLSLIHPKGISDSNFLMSMGLKNHNELQTLRIMKLINYNGKTISLSPLLSRLFFIDNPPSAEDCSCMVEAVCRIMDFESCENYADINSLMDYGIFLNDRLSELSCSPYFEMLQSRLAEGYSILGENAKSEKIALEIMKRHTPGTIYASRTITVIAVVYLNQWNYKASVRFLENAYEQRKTVDQPVPDQIRILQSLSKCYLAMNETDKLKWALNEMFDIAVRNKYTTFAFGTLMDAAMITNYSTKEMKNKLNAIFPILLERLDEDQLSVVQYLSLYAVVHKIKFLRRPGLDLNEIFETINLAVEKIGFLTNVKLLLKIRKIMRHAKEKGIETLTVLSKFISGDVDDASITEFIIACFDMTAKNYKDLGMTIESHSFMFNLLQLCEIFPVTFDKKLVENYFKVFSQNNTQLQEKLGIANVQTVDSIISQATFTGYIQGAHAAVRILNDVVKMLEVILPENNRYYLAVIYEQLGVWYSKIPDKHNSAVNAYLKSLEIKKKAKASPEEVAKMLLTLGNAARDGRRIRYYRQCIEQLEEAGVNNCTRCRACYNLALHYYREIEPDLTRKDIKEIKADNPDLVKSVRHDSAKDYVRMARQVRKKTKICSRECRMEQSFEILKERSFNSVGGLTYLKTLLTSFGSANSATHLSKLQSDVTGKSKLGTSKRLSGAALSALYRRYRKDENYQYIALFAAAEHLASMDLEYEYERFMNTVLKRLKRGRDLQPYEVHLVRLIPDVKDKVGAKRILMGLLNDKSYGSEGSIHSYQIVNILKRGSFMDLFYQTGSMRRLKKQALKRLFIHLLYTDTSVGFLVR